MGIGKRTKIDWSNHVVTTVENEYVLIHDLKQPDTICKRVRFINICGNLLVNGDYGRWSFYREFHPSKDGYVSDMYWIEKLEIMSTQDGSVFCDKRAKDEINEMIENAEDYGYSEPDVKWLEYLRDYKSDNEWAFHGELCNHTENIDGEDLPTGKVINPQLKFIFDAFEEICERMKNN